MQLVGLGMFAGGAGVAALLTYLGSWKCDTLVEEERPNCDKFTGRLWIPVVGPALAYGITEPDTLQHHLVGVVWSSVELVGLVLIAVGEIGHDVPASSAERRHARWQLVPAQTRDTTSFALRATF